MMICTVTYNGQTHYLMKQPTENWLFTSRTEIEDEVAATITVTTADNEVVVVGTNDQYLIEAIRTLVTENQSQRGYQMIRYYPDVIRVLTDYQALIHMTGFEIDFLRTEVALILNDAYLETMTEERVIQWEKALGIIPQSNYTLVNRRDAIIARFRAGYKLNTLAIASIVNAFTGGTAKSYFKDGVIYVKVAPPSNNKDYKFESVENEIKRRIPAHLGLNVERSYATWANIKDDFGTWQGVKSNLATWQDVTFHVSNNF